jgi:hypothetical protein
VRPLLALLCAIACVTLPLEARAASPLALEVQPLLGSGTPAVDGWLSAYVALDNRSNQVVRGKLSVHAELSWSRPGASGPRNTTEVPFSVAAQSQVWLEVPVHGFPGTPPSLRVVAESPEGERIAEAKSGELRAPDPLIFDLSSPSHVAPALRTIAVALVNSRWGGLASPLLSVSSARVEPRTGATIVPELPSGYASATVVLATGAQLAVLNDEARAALSDWLLAGGALALSLERPEDLRAPYVRAWAGGPVYETEAQAELREEAAFTLPLDPGGGSVGRSGGLTELRLTPSLDARTQLQGFRGGNLRPSPWGAVASYGLGELHLLAFRPGSEPFVSDPWAHHKLADLTRHAWDRSSAIALPHAEATLDESRLRLVRRELDPNEGTRWTIVVSALLLLAYAGLAGPLNFYLARRAGRPLRAFALLPVWSALALTLVVLLGVLGRGTSGRARRLTLIEAGAGMTRATATRFRGIYTSSTREHVVMASERGSVLDVAGEAEETGRQLVVDRDGARLTRLRGRPWEVVVVREDGFMGLGGGVSLLRSADGSVIIKNRLGRDLVGAVLMPSGARDARFFPRIKDGQAVTEAAGQALPLVRSGALGRSQLGLDAVRNQLEGSVPGLLAAWTAVEGATTRAIDFWPEAVPVLIGQLDGGEGKLTDSGFPIEADRALLRVVGEGGVP